MRRWAGILVVALLLPAAVQGEPEPRRKAAARTTQRRATPRKAKAPTSADVRRQRKQTEREMLQTSRELNRTEQELSASLRRISQLEEGIAGTTARAGQLEQRLDSIQRHSQAVASSIVSGEQRLKELRTAYTKAVRSSRRMRRDMNALTFIFSAQTFRQAWQRLRYLQEFGKWRRRKTAEITTLMAQLDARRRQLDDLKNQTATLHTQTLGEQQRLRTDRSKLDELSVSLKGRSAELNALLADQQKRLRSLDGQIERLIQQEAAAAEARRRAAAEKKRQQAEAKKKAAEKSASRKQQKQQPDKQQPNKPVQRPQHRDNPDEEPDSRVASTPEGAQFAALKGRLPSPVSGSYTVALGFGRQRHQSVSNVEVNNPGVDLETALGATARAVAPGTVSAVFVQEGLGHVVLVRHGEYITVYANIRNLSVRKGQKLVAGTPIGSIGPSDVNPSRGQLHFEIRCERRKLNPLSWLAR